MWEQFLGSIGGVAGLAGLLVVAWKVYNEKRAAALLPPATPSPMGASQDCAREVARRLDAIDERDKRRLDQDERFTDHMAQQTEILRSLKSISESTRDALKEMAALDREERDDRRYWRIRTGVDRAPSGGSQ